MPKKNSLKEIAYQTIKSKIINCVYPPSSFLNETSLMEELGVSRTPIREALSRLEQENLVRILPKKGVVVAEMSMNELYIIYETRSLIEPYLILTYGQTLSKDQLLSIREELNEVFTNGSLEDIYKEDDRLHQMFISAGNNKYLSQCMDHIYDQNHRLRILSGNRVNLRLEDSNQEHLEIIDQLLLSSPQKAANAMQLHLENSKNAALSLLLSNGTSYR